jgi:hypothetical protein
VAKVRANLSKSGDSRVHGYRRWSGPLHAEKNDGQGDHMMKRLAVGLFAGTLSFVTACSSGEGGAVSNVINGDHIDRPEGFPFAVAAFAVSDYCGIGVAANSCPLAKQRPPGATTATLSQPAAGKICLLGTVAPAGYAVVGLQFTEYDQQFTKVLKRFDADALKITQAAFTIDSPPSSGVTVHAGVIKQTECPAQFSDCFTAEFALMTAPLSMVIQNITDSKPRVAPFANFEQVNRDKSPLFDTTGLDQLYFVVGPGNYDFCVRDFKFLSAASVEVPPT